MLSDVELARMREDVERLLPDRCNILSVTRASDGQGGAVETWGTATAGAACRLERDVRGRGLEPVAAGAVRPFSYWTLTLPHGAAIVTEQRVEVGTRTFNVQSVDVGKSWSACVRAMVSEV